MANIWTGSRGGMKKVKLKTKQQQGLIDQNVDNPIENNPLYQQGSDWLSRILGNDPASFNAFAQPSINQFNQETVPTIANQFAGAGTGASGLSSSGLNNALAQASERLNTHLAGLRANLQQGATNTALNYAQQPINNRNDIINQQHQGFYHEQPSEGILQQTLRAGVKGASSAFGGPAAGALSDWAMNQFGQ